MPQDMVVVAASAAMPRDMVMVAASAAMPRAMVHAGTILLPTSEVGASAATRLPAIGTAARAAAAPQTVSDASARTIRVRTAAATEPAAAEARVPSALWAAAEAALPVAAPVRWPVEQSAVIVMLSRPAPRPAPGAGAASNIVQTAARPSIPVAGSASAVALETGGSRKRLGSRDRRGRTTSDRRKIVVRIAGLLGPLIVVRIAGPVAGRIMRIGGPVAGRIMRIGGLLGPLIVVRICGLLGPLIVVRIAGPVAGRIMRIAGPVEQATMVAERVTDARPRRSTRPPGVRGPAESLSCRRPPTLILACSTLRYVPNCAHSAS
jgi:hypothetical protein